MQYRLRIMKVDPLCIVYVLLFVAVVLIPLTREYSSFCPIGCNNCQPSDISKCSLCQTYFIAGPSNSCIYDTSLTGIELAKSTSDFTVSPSPTPTCSNISYNYGQYPNNTAATITSLTPIPQGHYQVELIVWIILFNNWSTGYIDFKLTSTGQNYSVTQANQMGSSSNYCYGSNIYVRFNASYTHSDTTAPITFNMTSILTTDGTFGIRDVLIIAKLCHSYCQLCTGSTNTTCTACKASYFLSGTTCNTACLAGYGPNLPSNVCVLCNSYCLTCNGSATNCSTCQSIVGGVQIYKVEDQNSCVATCSSGYFSQLSSQKCLLCSLHCVNISITGQLQPGNMTLQFLYTFSEAMNFTSFNYSTFLNFTSNNASINPATDFNIVYTAVNATQFKLQLTPISGKYLVNTNICTNILPQASNPVQYSLAPNQLSPSVYTTTSCVLWSTPQVGMTISGQVDASQTFGTFLLTFNDTMNFTSFNYANFVFFNTSNSSLNMISNFTVTYTMVNATSFTLKLMPNPQVYFTNATFCAITKAQGSTTLQFSASNYKLAFSVYNAYSCITFSTPKVNLTLNNQLDSSLQFGEFFFTFTAVMDFSSFNYNDFVILNQDNNLINLSTDFTIVYTAVNSTSFTLRLTPNLGVYFANTTFCAQSKSQSSTTLQFSQNLFKLDPSVYGQQTCFLWTIPSVNMTTTSQVLDNGKYAEFIFTFDEMMNLSNFNYSNFINFAFNEGGLNITSDFIINYTQVDSYSFKLNIAPVQEVRFKNMQFCTISNSRPNTPLQLSQNNTILNPTVYGQQSCVIWTSFYPSLFNQNEKGYFNNLYHFNNQIQQITTQKGTQEVIKTGVFAFLMPGAQLSTTVLLNQPIIAENLYEGSRFWGSFIFFDVPPYQQSSNKTKYTFNLPDKDIVKNQNHRRLQQTNSGTNFISEWKFDRTGHTGFFIVDAYIQMIMIGVSWLLVLLVWVYKKKCQPKSITLFKIKARVMAFFHKVHEVSFFYLILAGLMEYRNFDTNNSLHYISIIVASIFLLYYLVYELKIFYDLLSYPRVKIGTREYHQFVQNYGIFLAYYRFEEYNDKKILTWKQCFRPYQYHTLTFIKKALMLTAVPLFYDQYLWPVSILTFLQCLDIIRFLLTIPYHNFWRNLFYFILQVLLFIFFVCSLINQSLSLTIFDSNGLIVSIQNAITFKNSGWVGMIVLFLYNILYILSNLFEFFILLFTKSSIENLTWSNRHSYYQDLFDHFQTYGSYYRLVKNYTDELAYNTDRKQAKTFKGWVNRFHGAEPLVDLSGDDKLKVFKEIYERGNLFSTQFDETLTKDWVEIKIQSFKIKDFQRIIRLYNFRKGLVAPKHQDELIKHQTRSYQSHRNHSKLTSQTRSVKNTLTYKEDQPMLNFQIEYKIIPQVFVADPFKHKQQVKDNLYVPKKIKNTVYTFDLNPHFQKNLVMALISFQMPGTDQIKLSTILKVRLKQYEQGQKVPYRRENMRQQIMIKKGRKNHKIELKELIQGFPVDWQSLQKCNNNENQPIPDNNNDRTSRRLLNIEI